MKIGLLVLQLPSSFSRRDWTSLDDVVLFPGGVDCDVVAVVGAVVGSTDGVELQLVWRMFIAAITASATVFPIV